MKIDVQGQAIPVTLAASIIGTWVWLTQYFVTAEALDQRLDAYMHADQLDSQYLTKTEWQIAYIDMQMNLTKSELRHFEALDNMDQADQRRYELLKVSMEALTVERNKRIGR